MCKDIEFLLTEQICTSFFLKTNQSQSFFLGNKIHFGTKPFSLGFAFAKEGIARRPKGKPNLWSLRLLRNLTRLFELEIFIYNNFLKSIISLLAKRQSRALDEVNPCQIVYRHLLQNATLYKYMYIYK